jgi:hypothetical protein
LSQNRGTMAAFTSSMHYQHERPWASCRPRFHSVLVGLWHEIGRLQHCGAFRGFLVRHL